jgi:uncharacterized protein YjbI with pentapeptide repeats
MADDPDPRSLAALEKTVNDSAGKASVLWLSLVTLGTYLFIATGSVTQRDLFLDSTIKLPVLGVDLPVTGYFLFAPVLLLVLHFYVLLQLQGLGSKPADYNELLDGDFTEPPARRLMRRRLDDFPFVQFLAGVEGRRAGWVGFLLASICGITIVVFPLALLLQLLIVFLPFHGATVTWLHRGAIVADLVMVWVFWWTVMRPALLKGWLRMVTTGVGVFGTAAIVVFSIFLATYPGEAMHRNGVAGMVDAAVGFVLRDDARTASRLLFEGDIANASGRPNSLFSNRIILLEARIYDETSHRNAEVSASLRGRDLRGAILRRADLRRADFTGANLIEAALTGARLQDARFGCPDHVQFRMKLRGRFRQVVDAETCTDLRSADLTDAELQGASLDDARLQGAYLTRAKLQGASLAGANLTAASLSSARLEGASLAGATLLGALLFGAQMQGTDLGDADLNSATLYRTQLQGANIGNAKLANAEFNQANVYRTAIESDKYPDTAFRSVSTRDRFPRLPRTPGGRRADDILSEHPPAIDAEGHAAIVRRALDGVSNARTRALIVQRLAVLDPKVAHPADKRPARIDSTEETRRKVQRQRAAEMEKAMCAPADAPFVARGLINNGRIGPYLQGRTLGARLRDAAACPGARGLDASDLRELRRIEVRRRGRKAAPEGNQP